jgi:hypothetical protein
MTMSMWLAGGPSRTLTLRMLCMRKRLLLLLLTNIGA